MATKWTREETFQLIELFQNFQLLWDTNLTDYRDRAKKQNAIIILANTLNKQSEDVLKKIHNLRCQLQAEVRRVKIKQLEGLTYKSSWEYFDRLRFLLRDDKNTIPKLKSKGSKATNILIPGNINKTLMITCKPDIGNAGQIDGQVDQKLFLKPRFLFQNQQNTDGEEAKIEGIEQEVMERDEFAIFGDYVASELRNLDSPILRKKLKLKIQKALLEINEENITEFESQPGNKVVTTLTTTNAFDTTAFQVISTAQARQLQQQQQQLQQQQLQQQQQQLQQQSQANNLTKVEYCQL